MTKEAIVHDIIAELERIPMAYLQSLYEIIHTFRLQIPDPKDAVNDSVEVWDEVLDDALRNRQRNNAERFHTLGHLFEEDTHHVG